MPNHIRSLITPAVLGAAIVTSVCLAHAPLQPGTANAGEADVIKAAGQRMSNGTYIVIATIRHDDEGWEHYADRFEVVAPDGTILATRKLAHPHIYEQPFTRALTGVMIPSGVSEITVRAHDKTHALGGKEFTIKLEE